MRQTPTGAGLIVTSQNINPFEWSDIGQFEQLLTRLGQHGHREWPDSNEALEAELRYPRVQPETNVVFLRSDASQISGYGIVEPEPNIGRSVVGIGSINDELQEYRALIDKLMPLAQSVAPTVHIATRTTEIALIGLLKNLGWVHVRTYLKLHADAPQAVDVSDHPEMTSDVLKESEIGALTDLQNASFGTHFGYSPNTPQEIRIRLELPGSSFDDVRVLRNSGDELLGYCWIVDGADGGAGRIGMTGVSPAHQGQGLGRLAAQIGFNELVRRGAATIELDVDSANTAARKIYAAMGFLPKNEINWWEWRF